MTADHTGTRRPNVILIVADDLGYGDLAVYGSSVNRTTRIDQLAATGSFLTEFYMTSPVCSPSRAAIMTGGYPQRVGLGRGESHHVLFPGDAIGLHPAEHSLPRAFLTGGYRTGMVGKWHLGDQPEFLPTRHGFEEYLGLPYSNDMQPSDPRPHLTFPKLPLIEGDEVVETDPAQATLTDRYTDWALAFIKRHRRHPFFLYFAHMYVHTPIHTPQEYLDQSRNGAYGAAVEHLDHSVGQVVDLLEELELRRDTIVVVTSDNGSTGDGGASNAPLRGRKFETWEGGVRVPCIVSWPTKTRRSRVDGITTAMDFLPTFTSICSLPGPRQEIDGRDLTPLLFDSQDESSPHEVFYYFNADSLEAVRWHKWKLHITSGELFDLDADVGETRDLSDAYPEVMERIAELAEHARAALGDQSTGRAGSECRVPGRVKDPVTLTGFVDAETIDAMYD